MLVDDGMKWSLDRLSYFPGLKGKYKECVQKNLDSEQM